MNTYQILGIVLIVCGIYIFYHALNKLFYNLSDKTKCKIAKNIKDWGPNLITGLGLVTIIDLIITFPTNKNEILMLINGSKTISETNQDLQVTVILIIILIFGTILYLLGKKLYYRWICHKFIGVD